MRQFEEKETEWFCSATSNALVVRLESLVSILDVEECLLDAILDVMFPVWGVISGVSISHSDGVAFCSYDRCEVQFVAET